MDQSMMLGGSIGLIVGVVTVIGYYSRTWWHVAAFSILVGGVSTWLTMKFTDPAVLSELGLTNQNNLAIFGIAKIMFIFVLAMVMYWAVKRGERVKAQKQQA